MRDDEGAVAIMVAVFVAFAALAVLSLTTDLGSLRQSKRALVTDTDASALAGAVALAEDWRETGDCSPPIGAGQAATVLAENNPADQLTAPPTVQCDPSDFTGSVGVTAQQPSPDFFSGQGDLRAGGTTTAVFALRVSDFEEGLAICGDLFPGTGQLAPQFVLNNGNFAVPYHAAVQTLMGRLGTACGVQNQWLPPGGPAPTTPGGWGWLRGTCELSEDLTPVWCDVRVGTSQINSFGPVGATLRFPIFDAWNGQPGNNADLRIVGYASGRVEAACRIPGGGNAPKNPQDCNNPARLSSSFNGQPHFLILSDVEPYYFASPIARMFDEADYSICDVDQTGRFCP